METVRVQRRGGGRGDYTCRRAGALAAVVGSLLAAPAALRASPPESAPVSRRASAAWTVLLELPKEWAAFAPARARVRVEALAGHHVNLDYPAGFAPAPESAGDFPAGRVPLEAVRQEKCPGHEADVCAVEFALPLTPRGPAARIAGQVLFSICSADKCLIEKIALAAIR